MYLWHTHVLALQCSSGQEYEVSAEYKAMKDTESHIHTVIEGFGLDETSGDHLLQCLCSKQGHLEQTAQNCVQLGFAYLQKWAVINISGQLHLTSKNLTTHTIKKDFSRFYEIS